MSNEVITSILNHWGSGGLDKSSDGLIHSTTLGEHQFRFVRKTARARSKMLLKAAPLTKLVSGIVTATMGNDGESKDAKQVGASLIDNIGSMLSEIDSDVFDSLIYELVGWSEWKNPATDKFQAVEGQAYEQVLGDDLMIQVPLIVCVITANFLDFFLKESVE